MVGLLVGLVSKKMIPCHHLAPLGGASPHRCGSIASCGSAVASTSRAVAAAAFETESGHRTCALVKGKVEVRWNI